MSKEICVVCGSGCEGACSVSVLVEGFRTQKGHIGVRYSESLCTQCSALLTYDPWGDSNYTSGADEDRLILKLISKTLLDIAVEGLRMLREDPNAIPT